MKRRNFIQSLIYSGAALQLLGCGDNSQLGFLNQSKSVNTNKPSFFSACDHIVDRNTPSQHMVAKFNSDGIVDFMTPVPGRCHGSVQHPGKDSRVIVFSRRPGNFLLEINLENGEITRTVKSDTHNHFYGHGSFSADNQYLVTTENDFKNQQGLIVIRDANNYQVLEKYPSGGIGPHECAFLNHRQQLVIANGGILTLPSQAREKLNIDTMRPNLSYMDLKDGKILASYQPSHHQMSIRHLAVSPTDKVVIGIQFQGDKTAKIPLVALHQQQDNLVECFAPELVQLRMKQYTASVAINPVTQQAVITAPRGNLITLWDLSNNQFSQFARVQDSAGVSYDAQGKRFVLTNGKGNIQQWNSFDSQKTTAIHRNPKIKWDNHLIKLV